MENTENIKDEIKAMFESFNFTVTDMTVKMVYYTLSNGKARRVSWGKAKHHTNPFDIIRDSEDDNPEKRKSK